MNRAEFLLNKFYLNESSIIDLIKSFEKKYGVKLNYDTSDLRVSTDRSATSSHPLYIDDVLFMWMPLNRFLSFVRGDMKSLKPFFVFKRDKEHLDKFPKIKHLFENFEKNDAEEMYNIIFNLLSSGHAIFKNDRLINTGKYRNTVNNTSGQYITDDTANEYIKNFNKIYGSQEAFINLHNKYFKYDDFSKNSWLNNFKNKNILEK